MVKIPRFPFLGLGLEKDRKPLRNGVKCSRDEKIVRLALHQS